MTGTPDASAGALRTLGRMTDFSVLASRISGTVLGPDDDGFADAAGGFNTATVHSVAAVVTPETARDISETIRFARNEGLSVRTQATGHGNPAFHDGILVSMTALTDVSIDADTRTATFGGGARWGAIIAAAAEHGLSPVAGSSTTVGAVGFLLGGGMGPLARSHGFGSDYLRSLTVVTGAGDVVTASADDHDDLFWALRGGKGGLGIVVEATVALVELPALYAGTLFFDIADAKQVLDGWIAWQQTADERVSTSALIARFPDLEQLPPPLRGRHLIALRVAIPVDATRGSALAAPLRELAPVYLDAVDVLPIGDVGRIHDDPTEPGAGWGFGFGLSPLDAGFADAILSQFGAGSSVPFVAVEVRHWGGAMAVDVPEGSAVGGRDLAGGLHVVGVPDPSLFETVLPAASEGVRAVLAPWIAPTTTINYVDDPTDLVEFTKAWPDDTRLRLARERAQYDPDHVLPFGP